MASNDIFLFSGGITSYFLQHLYLGFNHTYYFQYIAIIHQPYVITFLNIQKMSYFLHIYQKKSFPTCIPLYYDKCWSIGGNCKIEKVNVIYEYCSDIAGKYLLVYSICCYSKRFIFLMFFGMDAFNINAIQWGHSCRML